MLTLGIVTTGICVKDIFHAPYTARVAMETPVRTARWLAGLLMTRNPRNDKGRTLRSRVTIPLFDPVLFTIGMTPQSSTLLTDPY